LPQIVFDFRNLLAAIGARIKGSLASCRQISRRTASLPGNLGDMDSGENMAVGYCSAICAVHLPPPASRLTPPKKRTPRGSMFVSPHQTYQSK